MIRKTLIVVLTAAAVAVVAAHALSHFKLLQCQRFSPGEIVVYKVELGDLRVFLEDGDWRKAGPEVEDRQFRAPGVRLWYERHSGGWRRLQAVLDLRVPALLFALYPALSVMPGPFRRWSRRRRGLCVTCGYNLTGNESGVCPECGTEIGRR